ncbi:MAG: InlB B-repeat-containing protein [Chitinispirillales bacterium]|jgi:uncharacterized repeat protein (TIGR02543 family)|nr:InlB B-repeat-containing protein [Chitinispirillales bacterium]
MDKNKFSGVNASAGMGAGKPLCAAIMSALFLLLFNVNTAAAAITIKFDTNSGNNVSNPSDSSIETPPGTLSALPEVAWTNHRFDGWYTTATGGSKITTSTSFSANTTVYAHWTALGVVNITFNSNGGTVIPSSQTGPNGVLAGWPANPARTGYTFDGWYTAATNGNKVDVNTVFTANTTVYAHWILNLYNITFDPNGGTVTTMSGTTGTGWKLSSLPSPAARTGYTFDGWYTAATGGTKIAVSTEFFADATVYARWTPVEYTLTYTLNGGTAEPANPAKYTIETPTFYLIEPTRTAYTFAGWTGANGTTPQLSVSVTQGSTGAKTYTAGWTAEYYTITFNARGGTVTLENAQTVAGGKLSSLPSPAARTGYNFDGWYTEETGGARVSANTTVFGNDAIVYARWTPVNYTITYTNLSGGTVTPANPTSYNIETPDFTLNNPTRIAYTFDGWTGANGTVKETIVSVAQGSTGNKSYNANWTANTYTITFDPTGGLVIPETGTTAAGGKLTSLPAPIMVNHVFDGWFTEATGGTKVTTNYVFGDDDVIYAQWSPVRTITFDANGGSASATTVKTGSGGKLASLPTATNAGYALDGWYTEATGGVKITTNTVFNEDASVYAHWVAGYAVTFDADENGSLTATVEGSSIAAGATVAQGKSVVFTAVPANGYEVDGWKVDGTAVADNTNNTYTLASVTTATTVTVSFKRSIAVASPERVIPGAGSDAGTAAVAPASALTAEFTAGPNPVGRSSGTVSFFRGGNRIVSAALFVYDASGNEVATVNIGNAPPADADGKRAVGSWDLRDRRGRTVPEGTYLVKGTVKTAGGKREPVSALIGVGR